MQVKALALSLKDVIFQYDKAVSTAVININAILIILQNYAVASNAPNGVAIACLNAVLAIFTCVPKNWPNMAAGARLRQEARTHWPHADAIGAPAGPISPA